MGGGQNAARGRDSGDSTLFILLIYNQKMAVDKSSCDPSTRPFKKKYNYNLKWKKTICGVILEIKQTILNKPFIEYPSMPGFQKIRSRGKLEK